MEHSQNAAEMLENLLCPAFIVKDGTIICANKSALERLIAIDAKVSDFISIGAEEYAQYTGGKLCLTLMAGDISYSATVTCLEQSHLFCLSSDYEMPELRAFALAARQLREPLNNALTETESLITETDPQVRQQLAQINRSLYQMLRAVCNMSDVAHYNSCGNLHTQNRDIVAMLSEILEKAANLVVQSQRTLTYNLPKQPIYTLVDEEKLERAVLNLISNAVKFTTKGGNIEVSLRQVKNRLLLTVQDNGSGISNRITSTLFSRFLREPGIDEGQSGIGLGLSIVRGAAAAHGGTLLMEQLCDSGAKFTMTIAVRQSSGTRVRTPILLPVDYAGSRDHAYLELSDVLPSSAYENI